MKKSKLLKQAVILLTPYVIAYAFKKYEEAQEKKNPVTDDEQTDTTDDSEK